MLTKPKSKQPRTRCGLTPIKLMKISLNVRLGFLITVLVVFAGTLQVFGGHPTWPPRQHTAEYREANMFFLRFQNALAAERWQEALSLCSDRVRAKAAEWASPKDFFNETIPIQILLSKDFGYWTLNADQVGGFDWTDKANLYGLFVTLTEPESKPVIQWYWTISATNQTWVVDYPPVKIEEYIAKQKAAIQERDDKAEQIRLSLEPKLKDIRTHLIPVSEQFVIGSPMLFRVELTNLGKTAVDYMNSGVAFAPLTVLDDKGQPLPSIEKPSQIGVGRSQVASGATVVLADKIDLNQHYAITKPGKYVVQFSGVNLEIGKPIPSRTSDLFGGNANEIFAPFDFLAVTNRITSKRITIKVTAGRK